jgi:hypothetical protein
MIEPRSRGCVTSSGRGLRHGRDAAVSEMLTVVAAAGGLMPELRVRPQAARVGCVHGRHPHRKVAICRAALACAAASRRLPCNVDKGHQDHRQRDQVHPVNLTRDRIPPMSCDAV